MENAADALKMAAAVLIFVLAISIAILSFGQVRQTADTVLNYKDRELSYIDGKYYYEASGTERSVSLETIIPTVFRVYLENYKVVFENLGKPLYKIKTTYVGDNGLKTETIEKRTLDLETNQGTKYQNVVLANDDQKSEFLCGILYRDFRISQTEFEKKFNVSLDGCSSLYDQLTELNGKIITEHLGVYYQNGDSQDDDLQDDDSKVQVPDVNKTEKRIITYKIQ